MRVRYSAGALLIVSTPSIRCALRPWMGLRAVSSGRSVCRHGRADVHRMNLQTVGEFAHEEKPVRGGCVLAGSGQSVGLVPHDLRRRVGVNRSLKEVLHPVTFGDREVSMFLSEGWRVCSARTDRAVTRRCGGVGDDHRRDRRGEHDR
jgi:hypothetical protein